VRRGARIIKAKVSGASAKVRDAARAEPQASPSGGRARPGALRVISVTEWSGARFKWFPALHGVQGEIELMPGDAVAVDKKRKLFHHRRTGTDGVVRTISEKFDCLIDSANDEVELELRVPEGIGPTISVERGELRLALQNFVVPVSGMFERLCAALNSSVWNPFGFFPKVSSHRADLRAGLLADNDGHPVRDDPPPAIPRIMTVRLDADRAERCGIDSLSGLPAGQYRARLREGADAPLVRLDGDDTNRVTVDTRFIAIDEFSRALADRAVEMLHSVEWRNLPLWEYSID
jgi:hypothetical protein